MPSASIIVRACRISVEQAQVVAEQVVGRQVGLGGVEFTLRDVAEIFKRTPYLADLKPGGRFLAKDMGEAGGVPMPRDEVEVDLVCCCYCRPEFHDACPLVSRMLARTWLTVCRSFTTVPPAVPI